MLQHASLVAFATPKGNYHIDPKLCRMHDHPFNSRYLDNYEDNHRYWIAEKAELLHEEFYGRAPSPKCPPRTVGLRKDAQIDNYRYTYRRDGRRITRLRPSAR